MDIKLLGYAQLKDLLPGSAIASFDEKIYLVASDGSSVTVLNKNWKFRETIPLSPTDDREPQGLPGKQFHAATIVSENKVPSLLTLGTGGSESGIAFLINLKTQARTEINVSPFYENIRQSGIETLNITGMVRMHDKMILCNSGGMDTKDNRLIVTSADFCGMKPSEAEIKQVKIEPEEEKDSITLRALHTPMRMTG